MPCLHGEVYTMILSDFVRSAADNGRNVKIGAPLANVLRKDSLKARSIRLDIDALTVPNVIFPLAKKPPAVGLSKNSVTVPHVAAKLTDI